MPARGVYVPPKQSGLGQLRDALLPILFVFVILFGSTYLLQASSEPPPASHKTLQELPLTADERAQYTKLIASGDVTQEQVVRAVETQQPDPNRYRLNIPLLLGLLAMIAVYLWFVFAVSFRQYRDVINEKFGPAPGNASHP